MLNSAHVMIAFTYVALFHYGASTKKQRKLTIRHFRGGVSVNFGDHSGCETIYHGGNVGFILIDSFSPNDEIDTPSTDP
jgi:hypothetical protein